MKVNVFNALVLAATAAADSCSLIDGMYYCNEVKQVQYEGIGFSGSYNKVTSMSNGFCSSTPFSFSGALSPIDEELSLHFRGPLHLNQFAAYTLSGSGGSKKREIAHHVHKREPKPAYVTQVVKETYFVTVDGDGNLVTTSAAATINAAAGTAAASAPATSAASSAPGAQSSAGGAPQGAPQSSAGGAPQSTPQGAAASSAGKSTSGEAPSSPAANNFNYNGLADASTTGPSSISTAAAPAATGKVSGGSGSGDWTRIGYYDASSGTSNGLTFLNNMGGAGSGVFDYTFGNSLSYAGSDGKSCAASPQVLSDTVLPSNSEVIIFTDNKCQGDDCGFYREGIPAYHGFDGANKIFLMEFEMPTESTVGAGTFNYDMPAIWALNAQIPRTLQYGNADCSCWLTGCGELDLFEVLSAGNSKCTTTLHTKQGGAGKGSPDYFARPTSGSIKAAVIFNNGAVTITTLDNSVDFSSALDDDTINGWISATSGSSSTVQL